jgi:hypothetical protein
MLKANQAVTMPDKPSAILDVLESRLAQIRDSLGDAGIRLRNFADRTIGPEPAEPTQGVPPKPAEAAAIQRIDRIVEELTQELGWVFRQIERVERI